MFSIGDQDPSAPCVLTREADGRTLLREKQPIVIINLPELECAEAEGRMRRIGPLIVKSVRSECASPRYNSIVVVVH